jgi:coiled-coil domain-containing protein 55
MVAASKETIRESSTNSESYEELDEDMIASKRALEMNESAGYEKIKVNDDGQVVDERQLLNAGLNIVKKPTIRRDDYVKTSRLHLQTPFNMRRPQSQSKRQQQTGEVIRQMQENERKKVMEVQRQKEDIIQQSKSRKTQDSISSARERYLARKREAQEQQDPRRKPALD